jgi:sugar phosphate isomerase/epimerase
MSRKFDRRDFLKTTGAIGIGAGLLAASHGVYAEEPTPGAPNAEKIGWRLGCQAYSFNRFTFFEAVDKTASLGLKYIEAYPGQRLSKENSAAMGESLSAGDRKTVQKKLADSGVTLVNFGVCGLPSEESGSRKVFDFAKEMGIETIVSEPSEDAMEMLDKLCGEYEINVAIHNHPKPSHYWNPDTVLKAVEGRSKRLGACTDTGHWVRSELSPLECLKKMKGRIISFHFKDLNELAASAHDVPWGTGASDVRAMLAEIHRQGVKAVFSIEYEYHWENSVPEIAQCVAFFDKFAADLQAKS